MIRVTFVLERGGEGNGKVWWCKHERSDIRVFGEGSARRVGIWDAALPFWLPKPAGKETYISRRLGTRIDGEAWYDLPAGAIVRAGAICAGGMRQAVVKSPPLIVEEGAEWVGESHSGTRWVRIRIINARPLTVEEAEQIMREFGYIQN